MKSGRVTFKGKLISLMTQKRHLPNGRIASLDVIEHPGAVLIVPFLDDHSVIFLRQYRAVIKKYLYELPAGTLSKNEKILACAKRELIEETGFSAKHFTRIGEIYPVPGYSTEIIYIFKAIDLYPQKGIQDEDEIIKTQTFTKSDIVKMFRQGKIVDAKTISALAFCGWL